MALDPAETKLNEGQISGSSGGGTTEKITKIDTSHTTDGDTTLLARTKPHKSDVRAADTRHSQLTSDYDATGTIRFDSTGTELIYAATTDVFYFTLSTAWDLSTATKQSTLSSYTGSESYGFYVSPDGTMMYITEYNGGDGTIHEYSLSTAYDASTASTTGANITVSNGLGGLTFTSDGTKMFVSTGGSVKEFALGTAWDLSTASSTGVTASTPSGGHIFMGANDKKLIVENGGDYAMDTYVMSTAGDLSTIGDEKAYQAEFPSGASAGVGVADGGSRIYASDSYLYQYDGEMNAVDTITFADADAEDGRVIRVKDRTGHASQYPITVQSEGYQVNGQSSISISTDGVKKEFQFDGSEWAEPE